MQTRTRNPITAALCGLAALALLAGCGGGGGSSSNNNNGGGGGSVKTANLSGKLTEKSNGYALSGRTIQVQNSLIGATTDSSGNFRLNSVPTGSVTFVIKDSNGSSNGTPTFTINSGQTTLNIVVDLSKIPPPPF